MAELTHPSHQPGLWDKIWRDRRGRGKVVIYQHPNFLLIGWAVFTVISLLTSGKISDIFSMIASIGLVVWAAWEAYSGVDYFRRALGALVFLFSLLSLYKNIFG